MNKTDVGYIEKTPSGGAMPAKYDAVFESARVATEKEHALSFREAVKKYPKSIFWALVLSLTIVMEGYDNILIGSFFAYVFLNYLFFL
jgi:hypothetical protein